MSFKKLLLWGLLPLLGLSGCGRLHHDMAHGERTTIDTALQVFADSVLLDEMKMVNAYDGQVIVMEVQTGAIRAMAGRRLQEDSTYQQVDNFSCQQEMGSLAKVATLLAAMETGRVKLSDTVETGGGVWPIEGYLIKDHNWEKGGYGQLSYEQALEVSSNIAICKALQEAFVMNVDKFLKMLDSMSYGEPDSIEGLVGLRPTRYSSPKDSNWVNSRFIYHAIGYERLMAPIQMLTFYNAIANGGKMMKPMLYEGEPTVINEQIASKENIEEMQRALYHVVSQGLGKMAETDLVEVAGKIGTAQLPVDEECDDNSQAYHLSFCGYFPAQSPKYSIMVSLNKKGLPASGGGMAGPVFRQIVEYLVKCTDMG